MAISQLENIYNSSIDLLIKKFISSENDFFLTEKDLHFYFFHQCLSKNPFEYNKILLIHTEYPMPLKVRKTGNEKEPIEEANDEGRAMRPHIDSILFNINFIKWVLESDEEEKEKYNYIRGLGNAYFPEYIEHFRKIYNGFYNKYRESILSHSLEFKFIRGGYEGIIQPVKEIQYDLKKLLLIAYPNKRIKFPFSKRATLLVFIGKRGNVKIAKKLEEKSKENKLFSYFERKDYNKGEHHVIRYDIKTL